MGMMRRIIYTFSPSEDDSLVTFKVSRAGGLHLWASVSREGIGPGSIDTGPYWLDLYKEHRGLERDGERKRASLGRIMVGGWITSRILVGSELVSIWSEKAAPSQYIRLA